jgi:hypothetical protein
MVNGRRANDTGASSLKRLHSTCLFPTSHWTFPLRRNDARGPPDALKQTLSQHVRSSTPVSCKPRRGSGVWAVCLFVGSGPDADAERQILDMHGCGCVLGVVQLPVCQTAEGCMMREGEQAFPDPL